MAYWLSKFEWSDCRNYDSRTSRDGGGYAFYEDWLEVKPGLYKIVHSTSSWLDYCQKLGHFTECSSGRCCYMWDGECHYDYKTFPATELQKRREEKLNQGWSLYKENHQWKEYKEKKEV